MCGLFGYFGPGADLRILNDALAASARRGPDGWGVVVDHLRHVGWGRCPPLAVDVPPRRVLGHARLATVLGTSDPTHAQPIAYGPVYLTHNGTVWNYLELAQGRCLTTGNDSEAFALCIALEPGSLMDAVQAAMAVVNLGKNYAFAVLRGDELVLAALNQHLYTHRDDTGLYWSSVKIGRQWQSVEGLVIGDQP